MNMIVLNLKNYPESYDRFSEYVSASSEVSEELGVRVVLCPPLLLTSKCAEMFSDVFSQKCDSSNMGPTTGSIPAKSLKLLKCTGSLLNHSENRVGSFEEIGRIINLLKEYELEQVVCAESPKEAGLISEFSPDFVAVEPKELIGGDVSVSTAKPDIISNSVDAVSGRSSILCGAGIKTPEDVKKAIDLGAEGVLIASGFVKSENPLGYLRSLAEVF